MLLQHVQQKADSSFSMSHQLYWVPSGRGDNLLQIRVPAAAPYFNWRWQEKKKRELPRTVCQERARPTLFARCCCRDPTLVANQASIHTFFPSELYQGTWAVWSSGREWCLSAGATRSCGTLTRLGGGTKASAFCRYDIKTNNPTTGAWLLAWLIN